MVSQSLRVALTASGEPPWGEIAGSEVMQLAEDRGLDCDADRVYEGVVNHAALSDVLVSAIRKPIDPPWLLPESLQNWSSACYLAPEGDALRRIVLVSNWNDERHYSECRSWFTMGEIAHYKLPMQMVVLVIGQQRFGKRYGPWTQGFLHPANRTLRFRKKSRSTSEVFNDKWSKVWREDHAEISRETWLESMLRDDVLPEVCFKVDVPVPGEVHIQRILDTAARQLDTLHEMKEKPAVQFSTCDWPVPCMFKKCCHVLPEREPSLKNGFVRISAGETTVD